MANILAKSQHSEAVGLLENRHKFKGIWGLTQFILSISRFIPDSRLKIKSLSQKEIELLPPDEAKNLEKELLKIEPIAYEELYKALQDTSEKEKALGTIEGEETEMIPETKELQVVEEQPEVSQEKTGEQARYEEKQKEKTPPKPAVRDYYQILGIDSDIPQDQIKSAYRKQMLLYHPDRVEAAFRTEKMSESEWQNLKIEYEEKAKDINEAYAVLSNGTNRAYYDRTRGKQPERTQKPTTAKSTPTEETATPRTYASPPPSQRPTPAGQPTGEGTSPESQNVYVGFDPTTAKTAPSVEVEEFKNKISTASPFNMDANTKFEIGQALINSGINPQELPLNANNVDVALAVYSQGGTSKGLANAAAEAVDANIISRSEEQFLDQSAFIVYGMENAEKRLTQRLQEEGGNPNILITPVPPAQLPALNLERSDGGFSLNLGSFRSLAETGVKKISGKVLKTTTKEVAKAEAKQLVIKGVKEGAKGILKKGATWLATKLGITALASVFAPGVGTAVAIALQVLGTLKNVAKNILSFIPRLLTGEKDTKKAIMGLGALMLVGGLATGSSGLALAGAGTIGASYLSSVGAATAGGQAMGFVQSFFTGLIYITAPIFTPALIAILVGIPLLVIFIVFIINNSAFVVPWGGYNFTPGVPESPYIGVEKKANPAGPFDNDTEITVTYTVTITAKQGALSAITFTYECKVYSENSLECPEVKNIRAGPQGGSLQNFNTFEEAIPEFINPGQPYVIMYDVVYGDIDGDGDFDFNDSLVVDTFTVAANAEGNGRSEASGIASIIIGTPPTACFSVVDTAQPWPPDYAANMNSAVTTLVSQHSTFAAKVCSGGTVNLCYDPAAVDPGAWGWHTHTPACDVKFSAGGVTNSSNATYILTHEVSHHLQYIMGSLQVAYEDLVGRLTELPFCTDDRTDTMPTEAFAEMNALYVQTPSFWCGGVFQSKYPIHYQFADQQVFR